MKTKGIDVSAYQGSIDWNMAAQSGVEFAVLKIIRKNQMPDTRFEINWGGCRAAGLRVQGVYNYSYADTVTKAGEDAKKVLEILEGRKPMVWLDVEDSCQKNLGELLADIINAYGEIITSNGLAFGVYTGLEFYNDYMKPYAGQITYPFWIARYPTGEKMNISRETEEKKRPVIAHELWGWQYSSKGSVPGINGDVDLNEWYAEMKTEAAEPENTEALKPEHAEQELHSVGEYIKVSSYYNSSTAPFEHAVIRNAEGTIIRIKKGMRNPYCFGKDGIPTGWCNDGDIRESSQKEEKEQEGAAERTHTVLSGDTLLALARKYQTTVSAIVNKNRVSYPQIKPDFIRVGWKLKI